jgi:hypothetical protein
MTFILLALTSPDTASWLVLAALALALEAAGLLGAHINGYRLRPLTWIVRGAMHRSYAFYTALFVFLAWLIVHFYGGND